MCWDFSQVHVVGREALKVFVSAEDAETQSEDVRVWSGANIVLPVGFSVCSFLGFFFVCFVFVFSFSTKNNGGAGEGGSQTWDEWHITKKIYDIHLRKLWQKYLIPDTSSGAFQRGRNVFLAVAVNTSGIRAASGSGWHDCIEKEGNICRCRELMWIRY